MRSRITYKLSVMNFSIIQKKPKDSQLFIIGDVKELRNVSALERNEKTYVKKAAESGDSLITINKLKKYFLVYIIEEKGNDTDTSEAIRKAGARVQALTNQYKIDDICITNYSKNTNAAYILAEGIGLANYQFLKYKGDARKLKNSLKTVHFTDDSIDRKQAQQLRIINDAVSHSRDLVNEPLSYLTAMQLSEEIARIGDKGGFAVNTLHKDEIVKEGMGGLLAVNRGSMHPPTFNIMEYKPDDAINEHPIVLVGKGVVYDTGGLSLKPTPASMDRMKSDMSGSAVVIGSMYAVAKMKLPIHIVALVPASDNRPGQDAYVPGDVITMYSGTTVEVLNTDAEGRLLLADALHYAKQYKPELVCDFATLTGAAAIAVGPYGIVCMGTADEYTKQLMRDGGDRQYERLVEYPLWEEYGAQLKSDIADMKNIGSREGGAISAGKFLEHFTDYPWMHFDIAGVSFSTAKKDYIPSGGTAYGVRMLLDFLQQRSQPNIEEE